MLTRGLILILLIAHDTFSLFFFTQQDNFLPAYIGPEVDYDSDLDSDITERRKRKISITEKIMKFAIEIENITAAGRHAATQVLLRLNYLKFGGYLEELVSSIILLQITFLLFSAIFLYLTNCFPFCFKDHYGGSSLSASDFDLGEEIRSAIDEITIERTTPGAKPHKKISDDRFYEAELPKRWKMVHHGISKLQSVSFQVVSVY